MQALYHRKHALRQQYKLIVQIQKEGLGILAEKSLELVKDLHYHENLAEFDKLSASLKARSDANNKVVDKEYEYKRAYAAKKLAMDLDYQERLHKVSIVSMNL